MSSLSVMILCGRSPRHLYVANRLCEGARPLAIVQETGMQWSAKKIVRTLRRGGLWRKASRLLRDRRRFKGDAEARFFFGTQPARLVRRELLLEVSNINHPDVVALEGRLQPDVIAVFGTSLIHGPLLSSGPLDKSATICNGTGCTQSTGSGQTGGTDPVIAQQTFNTSGTAVGSLDEVGGTNSPAAVSTSSIDPLNFCGGVACIGNEVIVSKVNLVTATTTRTIVDYFYNRKVLGLSTGVSYTVWVQNLDPSDTLGIHQIVQCPSTKKGGPPAADACVMKLTAQPAQNPNLLVEISFPEGWVDPAAGTRS